MSLDWNLRDCRDHRELTADDEWPTTEAVIWLTMVTDVGHLHKVQDCEEFYWRYRMVCQMWGDKVELSLNDILRRRGLRTNVPNKPRAGWLKAKASLLGEKVTRSIYYETHPKE